MNEELLNAETLTTYLRKHQYPYNLDARFIAQIYQFTGLLPTRFGDYASYISPEKKYASVYGALATFCGFSTQKEAYHFWSHQVGTIYPMYEIGWEGQLAPSSGSNRIYAEGQKLFWTFYLAGTMKETVLKPGEAHQESEYAKIYCVNSEEVEWVKSFFKEKI